MKNKLILFCTTLFLICTSSAQNITYSDLNNTADSFKKELSYNNQYFSGGSSEYPFFQGKQSYSYIKFYNSTITTCVIDFQSEQNYISLIKEIQRKATFRFKFCTDYDEPVIYSYLTNNGHNIRFDFNEMRISIEYPSTINTFLKSNSEITSVFVCVSDGAYAYHTNLKCSGLANCDKKIAKTNIKEAKKYNFKICEICTDDSYSKKLLLDEKENQSSNISNRVSTVDLQFAKKYEGKYMFKEICETEPLKSELIDRLGPELHEKFVAYIAVQGPMKIENNRTLLTSCMAHACTFHESSFMMDFENNFYYLGILDEKNVHVFSNNSSFSSKDIKTFPSEFMEWTNNAWIEADRN